MMNVRVVMMNATVISLLFATGGFTPLSALQSMKEFDE